MKARIGIRPVIDGRGSVRELLEEKTREMALAAKRLIEENVFYLDGTHAECVLAPSSIGCRAEAARADELFEREGVAATLSVTPIFCYGTETFDFSPHTVKAVWGFNGTERPGAVYLACAMSGYAEYGLPAFSIYGRNVQDLNDNSVPEDVREKILRFARCAVAVGEMKNRSYLAVGGVAMGIAGSFLDPRLLQEHFGMHAEWVDMSEVKRRLEKGIYDPDEYARAIGWVRENIREGREYYNREGSRHSRAQLDADWENCVKMALIFRDLMQGNPRLYELGFSEESLGRDAIAGGFQGQRHWTDYMPNADFAESILNSSFDWNGARPPLAFATENDTLNGLTMLMQQLLTKQASVFADVRTYWSAEAVKRVSGVTLSGRAVNGFIHLNNSGAAALDGSGAMRCAGSPCMKRWWEVTREDIQAALQATEWPPANLEYFRGGGFSSHFVTNAEMPVTMMRLNRVKGLGPVLQVAEGYTVHLDPGLLSLIEARTDPAWPSTFFVPNLAGSCGSVYDVMANWGANHSCFTYGHIGGDALTLASMLRIPVSLHNVPDERVFRPHVWASFGKPESVGADFRACRNFGPLYR